MDTRIKFDNVALAQITLRSASLALALAGKPAASASLSKLADLVAAGQATDAHMQEIADKLKGGAAIDDDDFADVGARIEAESAKLQAP